MNDCLRLSIRHNDRQPFSAAFSEPIELGRRDPSRQQEDFLFQPIAIEGGVRVAIDVDPHSFL